MCAPHHDFFNSSLAEFPRFRVGRCVHPMTYVYSSSLAVTSVVPLLASLLAAPSGRKCFRISNLPTSSAHRLVRLHALNLQGNDIGDAAELGRLPFLIDANLSHNVLVGTS